MKVSLLLPLVLVGFTFFGCLKRGPGVLTHEATPERKMFSALSSFYCDNRRWPTAVNELSNGGDLSIPGAKSYIDSATALYFASATISSSRALLFSLDYSPQQETTEGNASRRRATFIAPPGCGAELLPGEVSIAGGRVTFSVPNGYTPLTLEQIKERWGGGTAPDVAWSDATGSDATGQGVVAVRFGEAQLTVEEMERFKAGVEASYSRTVPGIDWIRRELSQTSVPPMLLHEFDSDSSRGRLRTIAYSLSFDAKLLSITVTGPASSNLLVQEVAALVRDTISLK
jgi:hypothetical protein